MIFHETAESWGSGEEELLANRGVRHPSCLNTGSPLGDSLDGAERQPVLLLPPPSQELGLCRGRSFVHSQIAETTAGMWAGTQSLGITCLVRCEGVLFSGPFSCFSFCWVTGSSWRGQGASDSFFYPLSFSLLPLLPSLPVFHFSWTHLMLPASSSFPLLSIWTTLFSVSLFSSFFLLPPPSLPPPWASSGTLRSLNLPHQPPSKGALAGGCSTPWAGSLVLGTPTSASHQDLTGDTPPTCSLLAGTIHWALGS